MKPAEFLAKPSQWLIGDGPEGNIVVSSRIRFARNIKCKPFPGWGKRNERLEVLHIVWPVVENLPQMHDALSVGMDSLGMLEKQLLVERHLISREHAAKSIGSAVVITPEQTLSIMINEEDHLRIQALLGGFQLQQVFSIINQADEYLEDKLDYAFSEQLGYLTACPTNVGTGMRASAMLHLPGLFMSEQIPKIINSVNKIGLAVRGIHGEGTEAMGNLFQVSNQTTLGESEEDILNHLQKVISQIIEHEKNARLSLLEKRLNFVHDTIGRAYGILLHCASINSKEALNLLSSIKLGLDCGFFPSHFRQFIDELFIEIQPAHLQKFFNTTKLNPQERDCLRAQFIRQKLSHLPPPSFLHSSNQPPPNPQNN
ncbi:MAG: protein arginine kinase [Chthoniobacterales bacterium]|nr:protein arginine kinase [Chthoniobacterales bacterium]